MQYNIKAFFGNYSKVEQVFPSYTDAKTKAVELESMGAIVCIEMVPTNLGKSILDKIEAMFEQQTKNNC
jgi:hypothetical protein